MKKMILLLAVTTAFTMSAFAQGADQAGSAHGTTTDSATKKSDKKKGGDEPSKTGNPVGQTGTKSGKGNTLTGCLSSSPNAEGMYTLSNAKMKKGVEVGPADKVKEHAGHQVSLMGKWSTAAEAGEKAEATEKKGERHFEVDSVKHISETCSEATAGSKAKSKDKS